LIGNLGRQQALFFKKGVAIWVDVHVVEAVGMVMEPVALLPRGVNWWSL
jgi:hypothetical protein